MNQQLIADIKASKSELERRGWRKHALVGANGQVCALGAIGCALVQGYEWNQSYDPFNRDTRAAAVVRALAARVEDSCYDDPVDIVFQKNDHRETKMEDVYNLFDKALAEEGGLA